MKRRIKAALLILSVALCVVIVGMFVWGLWRIDYVYFARSGRVFQIEFGRGAIAAYTRHNRQDNSVDIDYKERGDKPLFWLPDFGRDPDFPPRGEPFFQFLLPYWLLFLLFAIGPALWLRGRYVARRDKKQFAAAVAAKCAELEARGEKVPPNFGKS